MAITHPFDLPEIREALAPYLSTHVLARCIRVCKSWHSSFYPFLWTSVDVPAERDKQPLERLRMHHTLVYRLLYRGDIPDSHLSIHYPKLRTLCVRINNSNDLAFDTIVKNHPLLTHLDIRQQNLTLSVKWFFPDTLSNLRTLRLIGVTLFLTNSEAFWNVCSQLETLDLQAAVIMDVVEPSETPWKVKDLSLVTLRWMTAWGQLRLINRCPELRRLHWGPRRGLFHRDSFLQSMLADTWPMLEDLCLEHSKISDQELSQIIGKMRRVTGLSVARSHFNMESMSALRSHFLSLRRLNIADILDTADDTTSSEFAIEVLKSCPRLERLKAEGVSAEYMMDNAPWACEISLKVLEMSFNHVINDSQHEAIMGRLAKLVNLERLDVSNSWSGNTITFQLRRGLGKLSTLMGLRKLVLPTNMQYLSMDDVEWMIQHWSNLTTIEGTLGWNHGDPQILIDRFSAAGVRTQKLVVDPLQDYIQNMNLE